MSDNTPNVRKIEEYANGLVRHGAMSGGSKEAVVDPLLEIVASLQAQLNAKDTEIESLKWRIAHPVVCQGICTSQADDYCGMHMHNESCIACNAIWTAAHVENAQRTKDAPIAERDATIARLRDDHKAMWAALSDILGNTDDEGAKDCAMACLQSLKEPNE